MAVREVGVEGPGYSPGRLRTLLMFYGVGREFESSGKPFFFFGSLLGMRFYIQHRLMYYYGFCFHITSCEIRSSCRLIYVFAYSRLRFVHHSLCLRNQAQMPQWIP